MINNLRLKDDFSKWADSHVFYNMFTHKPTDSNNKACNDENEWREKIIKEAPNGSLLVENSFFNLLKKDTIYLAHVTPNLHNILKQNNLYPSGGCLVGSIYCVPIREEDGKFYVSNLGDYIFNEEVPNLLGKDASSSKDILISKLNISETERNNLIGIDYLRLGDIHFDIYNQLKYLLSFSERDSMQETCVRRIRASMEYLSLCNKMYHCDQNTNNEEFFRAFNLAIEHLPILGYFYFEVISEYIMLFQDNDKSIFFKEKGEFFSPSYKNLVPKLSPQSSQNFSLRQFRPDIKEVIDYIEKSEIFKNFNQESFIHYLKKRLCFLTNARLLNGNDSPIEWNKIQWNFDYLSQYMSPLLGHLIHRELRNFKRYPNFYFYFDQYKALQAWNYWNHMNIAITFNGVIPKDEVGINPACPDLKYQFYTSKTFRENDFLRIEPEKEIDINVMPKLVDLKFTTMRNKDHLCNI